MSQDQNNRKEYYVSVNADDLREAIAAVASALYSFAEEALSTGDEDVSEEWEFETFLRDVLGVLTSHAEQLAEGEASWQTPPEEVSPYD